MVSFVTDWQERKGWSWMGMEGLGRLGGARQGLDSRGKIWCGRRGKSRSRGVRLGLFRPGMAGMARCGCEGPSKTRY